MPAKPSDDFQDIFAHKVAHGEILILHVELAGATRA